MTKLLKDVVVKKLFTSGTEASKEFLFRIISAVTDIKIKDLENDFELIHTEPSVNNNIINSELDLVGETSEDFINIEFNYQNKGDKNNILRDKKNFSYLCQLYLRNIKHKKDYEKIKRIWQIQLDDFDYFGKGKFIYTSEIREINYNMPRGNDLRIIDINLDYLSKLGYTNINKRDILEKSLYIFVCNDDEKLKELYEDDEIMKEIKNEVDSFDEAFDNLLYYNKEELEDKIAIMNNNERIIIKMLENNYSIQEVKKIIGYTEKEIEKVWERHLLEEAMEKDTETLHKLIRELIAKHPGISYHSFVEITTHLGYHEIEAILKEDSKE